MNKINAKTYYNYLGITPFAYQKQTFNCFLNNENGLVNAPTGTGKTYALWIPALAMIHHQMKEQKGIKILWVTPLRALAKDIEANMKEAAEKLNIPIKIGKRTGDNTSWENRKIKKSPPDCLIITPESIHILMAQQGYKNLFKNLKYVIVDEWHELMGSKRGVQIELALARFRTLNPFLSIWGISATIGNLEQAARVLTGYIENTIIKAEIEKNIQVKSIIPDKLEKFSHAGHLGINLIDDVIPVIENSNTTLLFTNTRSQSELWYQKMLEKAPDLTGKMALHHGSIDTYIKLWVEEALNKGQLKLVICTSSLDLGIDFRPVDTVIQIGSPKGVSRFLQRAGRSGHKPGAISKIYFVPSHSLELIEGCALRHAVYEKNVEDRRPVECPLDVLIQYMITLAVSEGFEEDKLYQEIIHTYSYRNLDKKTWNWCLNFIMKGGNSLSQYDEFERVEKIDNKYIVRKKSIIRRHRLSIGTIVGDPVLKVKYITGGLIGTIESHFISKMNKGDIFWLAGRSLKLMHIKENIVFVKNAGKKKGTTPQWMGGRMPLTSQLAGLIRQKIEDAGNNNYSEKELKFLKPLIRLQQYWSHIPKNEDLLVEKIKSKEGYHIFLYPFEGRLIHEIIAALLAYRIGKIEPRSFSIAMNDYGFELLSDQPIPFEEALNQGLFSKTNLLEDINNSINQSEMAKGYFRDIASIAGLVFQGFPGKTHSDKHLQTSTRLLFDVFSDYEPDNLLINQAYNEVFNYQIEKTRLVETLNNIQKMNIKVKNPPRITPFAFPIMADRLRTKLSTENLEDRLNRMTEKLEKKAEADFNL